MAVTKEFKLIPTRRFFPSPLYFLLAGSTNNVNDNDIDELEEDEDKKED